jgi:filamentous hemagglutinin
VPQAAAKIIVPANLGDAAAAATKAASDSTLENEDDSTKKRKRKAVKVALLDAQLIGFGNCSVGDIRENKAGCGNK